MSFLKIAAYSSVLALSLSFGNAMAADSAPHHWDYSAEHGAATWGAIAPEYEACRDGVKQSPINISHYKRTDLPDITFSYSEIPLSVLNNGHTVQVNVPEGQKIMVGDRPYMLLQVHFHTPSEHYLDGTPFPMEAHFVHKAEDGALGVIGVMLKVGHQNATIAQIWDHVPAVAETKSPEGVMMSLLDLLPADSEYYAYDGSLTTPPCSEIVSWHVMKQPIEISEQQLRAFQTLFPSNARPIQNLGQRVVEGD